MAAGNALKWSPDKTMKIAQRLYEQGLITYHRTDNPNISKDSMPDIRAVAKALGLKCVEQQRMFKADQDAQEGHPAITPPIGRPLPPVKLLMSRPCTSSFEFVRLPARSKLPCTQ